jgi:3-(3-hydroxy-phenyl)propionate hydroxylase
VKTYTQPRYAYARVADQDGTAARKPVIVVGAGPVGLALAIDLGLRGIPVVVLDDDDTVSVGSRAICYAKRSSRSSTVSAAPADLRTGRGLERRQGVPPTPGVPVRLCTTRHHRPGWSTCSSTTRGGARAPCAVPGVDLRWKQKDRRRAARRWVDVAVERLRARARLPRLARACDGGAEPVRRLAR